MEAFDAAVAWWGTAIRMIAFCSVGVIAFLVFWGIFAPRKAHRKKTSEVVMATFSVALPVLYIMTAMFVLEAQQGVKAACSDLPGNIGASGIRLTSFDERDIEAHCGAPTLREIVNQTARQPDRVAFEASHEGQVRPKGEN